MAIEQRARVLLVEPNETVGDALCTVLEECGHVVVQAPDTTAALDWLRHSPYRLVVVLNLWLPNLHTRRVVGAVAADASLSTRHAYLLLTAYDGTPFPSTVTQLLATPHSVVLIERYSTEGLVAAVAVAAALLTHPRT